MKCPYCGNDTKLKHGLYGPKYHCFDCDAYVGCHPGTIKPLGTLANKELREIRVKAHRIFDYWRKARNISRRDAYRKLADQLGIEMKDCHIGHFDTKMCNKVIEVIQNELNHDELELINLC